MAIELSNPLGHATQYPTQFNPELLFAITRAQSRRVLFDESLPFTGYDRWTAYELSWLNPKGKPEIRVAEFIIDSASPAIVESKSFKLYLNSYNQTVFANEQKVIEQLCKDLSAGFGSTVDVQIFHLDDLSSRLSIENIPADCIDTLDIDVERYEPNADVLQIGDEWRDKKLLYSHLLKTNCPITDQPDWATVYIEYTGQEIVPASLLQYIVSFRQHQGYHENCVEQMFCDINNICQPENLTVYARYTRRGGLDINPLRSNYEKEESKLWGRVLRGLRQ